MSPSLLDRLPDAPRWVEVRGLLRSGIGRLLHDGEDGSFLVLDPGFPGLLSVGGRPPPAALAAAVARLGPAAEILATPEDLPPLAAALPGWRPRRAILHLPGPGADDALPEPGPRVRRLRPEEAPRLAHLPERLRAELLPALSRSPFVAGFAGDTPVSFCYAGSRTERLWDVAIETLEPYRRRGLASRAASLLIRQQRAEGREPVWGALEDNAASRGLAARLGFVPVDALYVFARRAGDRGRL